MNIDVKIIKELSEDIEKYGLEEITLENEGTKITLKREVEKQVINEAVETQRVIPVQKNITKAKTNAKAPLKEVVETESIKSPMVGTFYGSPSPDADLFVKEGQVVNPGETLCIVEAMKLMNEVKAEKKCKILKNLLVDGDPVTKGLNLFLIEEL